MKTLHGYFGELLKQTNKKWTKQTRQKKTIYFFFAFVPEFQGAGKTRAVESSSGWLDLVLPGDRVLQEKVGGGQRDGIQGAQPTQGLS